MTFSLGEYQDIFLEEADEQLQELNQNLLELEKNPDDIEIINNIFRAAHSLKSSAAFVGLNDLSDLAHKMENLLQGIRDRTMDVTDEVVDIIFKCFDEINSVIESIAAGEKPDQDLKWIIDEIQSVHENARVDDGEKVETGTFKRDSVSSIAVPKTEITSESRKRIKDGINDGKTCYEITIHIEEKAQMKWVKAQLVLNNLGKISDIVMTIPPAQDLNDDDMNNVFKVIILTELQLDEIKKACNVDLVYQVEIRSISLAKKDNKLMLKFGESESIDNAADEDRSAGGETVQDTAEEAENVIMDEEVSHIEEEFEEEDDEFVELEGAVLKSGKKEVDPDRKRVAAFKTVKVSIDKLDLLLNNVGELVIANSGFYKLYEELRKVSDEKAIISEFKSKMEMMSRIAKDLQTGIMKTRMVPIGQVFSRFKRLVRDLAKESGKNVELNIKGEETELDKKVIDSIGEPLLHLIRNAIDHGIESDEERKKIGKSEVAHITLNAYQGGNQIFVEVSDDGKGMNVDLIRRKALERGLATAEMLSAMDDADIFNFIFTPGFSTAEKVTDISGRGVGMNVVKEIVNELNGSVAIETEVGMGTRFVLSFPITLAIIPAIMTRVRKEMYAIPLTDVIETIKISQSDITTIEGHEVINLRGEILSLLRLNRFIGLKTALSEEQKIPVVVVGFGNRKIGLIVDFLEGKQEIVIKSLEQNYATVEGLAGASILGDGSICLILDISSMINKVIAEQDKISRFERERIIDNSETKYEEIEPPDIIEEKKAPVAETVKKEPVAAKAETVIKKDAVSAKPAETVIEKKEPAPVTPKEEPLPEIKETPPEPVQAETSEPEKPADDFFFIDSSATPTTLGAKESKIDKKPESEEDIRQKVHETLDDIKQELRDSIKSTISSGGPSDHMTDTLDIAKEDLNEFQVVANIGAANAAESLSKIINKRIDLSIPEVTVMPTEQIPKFIGDIDSIYMGIMMPIVGDSKGTVLFIFNEDTGFQLVDLLFGTDTNETKELNEDGESALQELTNIIGSAVINVFAEKTGLVIKPGLPTIVHDYLQSVIDSILVIHNMIDEYAIVMDTAFYFADDKIIGNLLILPEIESLKIIVERMRSHV